MRLPDEVRAGVEACCGKIEKFEVVGGGSISRAGRVEVRGGRYFVKFEQGAPPDFFRVEAAGLRELAAVGAVRVPEVVAVGGGDGGWGWFVTEWVEWVDAGEDGWRGCGAALAALHRSGGGAGWGWEHDGYIGRLPQVNGPVEGWPDFWWERRLYPQLVRLGDPIGRAAEWDRLRSSLPELLATGDHEGASPLHGDLWRGNVIFDRAGGVLIDPAFYRGHREVDLAMAELFGGFPAAFFEGYGAVWPLAEGYEARRDIYQLYYLLVHLNLFGASYVTPTLETLRRVLSLAR